MVATPGREVVFMHGGRIPRCAVTIDKRFGYHLLQLMTAGGVDLWRDEHRFAMRGPHVWLCRPGPRYYFHETPRGRPWNHRYLAFTGDLATHWRSTGLLHDQPQPLPEQHADAWAERFDRLIDQSQRTDRWSRRRAVNLLEGILIDLAERRDTTLHDPPRWLQRVLAELRPGVEPDYEAIARGQGMSLSTLQRRFRKATGTTPHTFYLQQRTAEARRLLGETDLPIKQIADRLGYHDVFYFTRQFKQWVGVAPAAFRKSRQGAGA